MNWLTWAGRVGSIEVLGGGLEGGRWRGCGGGFPGAKSETYKNPCKGDSEGAESVGAHEQHNEYEYWLEAQQDCSPAGEDRSGRDRRGDEDHSEKGRDETDAEYGGYDGLSD